MVNFADEEKSLKAAWVNRYCSSDGHHWCAILDSQLVKFGGSFSFKCHYDLNFLDLEGLPVFYRNILTVWQTFHSKVPLSVNEIKEEILWKNRFIKMGIKTVFYKACVSKGILRIKDILNVHDNVLSFQDLQDSFDVRCTFLDFGGLLAAIPKDRKNAISQGNQSHTNEPKVTKLTVGNVSAKYARLLFAEKSFCPPLIESYLREQTFTPSAVYELPFKNTMENKLRFQFKLIHNILPTSQRLWKMNVESSPKSEQCEVPCETISHIFYECPAIKIFWEKVIDLWNRKRSENINPNPTEVLYGYKPESNTFHSFNHYLLIARYYVYLARNKFETPQLEVFIELLEIKIQCERRIAITN